MISLIHNVLESYPAYIKEVNPSCAPGRLVIAYEVQKDCWSVEFVSIDDQDPPPYVGMRGKLLKNLIGIISFTWCPDYEASDQDQAS